MKKILLISGFLIILAFPASTFRLVEKICHLPVTGKQAIVLLPADASMASNKKSNGSEKNVVYRHYHRKKYE